MKLTIKEIEQKLGTIKDEKDDFFRQLQKDERKGVQAIVKKWQRLRELRQLQHEKFINMTVYERKYRQEGYQLIAGIDEVGRGPLAGPVVASAVILPHDFYLPGIDDSKKLNEQKREQFYTQIKEAALAVGLGIIDNDEIDRLNIFAATKKAMSLAISQLEPKPDFLLIDAVKLDIPYQQEPIIKGDGLSISIAAASIVAKVTRDRILKDYDQEYPNYGFANHAGYGTKEHLEAIRTYGITPIHRKSFSPIKEYIS
ncbi:ribonuclease HII [Niallia oryzisoli]|uniref:Ribonuclease HII n=1 Tax=Niallia oryzisoli TaxID=1737571 RepID=A0ABZ2CHH4_9BACI